MKKYVLLIVASMLGSFHAVANDDCRISIGVQVAEQSQSIPAELLESKLRDAVTLNGMEGNVKSAYFVLVANASETSKELTAGLRPLVSVTLDVNLYVCNQFTGEKFASTTLTISGSGRSDYSAGKSALAAVNGRNKHIQVFLQSAKRRIEEYYSSQVSAVIAEASKKSALHEYEEALFILSSVPVCVEKYKKVEKALSETFKLYTDYDSATKLAKARNVWNASQNKAGALLAGAYLAAIAPSSSSYGDALKLEKTIREKVGEEVEFGREMQRSLQELDKERINAARAIGVAYGENQQPVIIREE